MKNILTITGLVLMLILGLLLVKNTSRLNKYNDNMCQMYGYEADCQTKLK